MTSHRVLALIAAPVAITIALTGCSSSKSTASSSTSASADGNKSDLCAVNSQLDDATSSVTTPAELLAAFKAHSAQVDQLLGDAPSAIKADVQTLVNAVHQAIQSNDVTPLTSDPNIDAAGKRLDAFCGVSEDSDSPSAPSDSGSSS